MPVRPNTVTILGIPYRIDYCTDLYDVDQSAQLGGVIQFEKCRIAVLDRGQPREHVWQILFHEVLHALVDNLQITALEGDEGHQQLDRLATGINDVLIRNGWYTDDFGLGAGS